MALNKKLTVHGGTLDFTKRAAVEVKISGEDAGNLLLRNQHNRMMSAAIVDAYERDMIHDRWNYDGSPLRFDYDGWLLDGQQRLTAHSRHPDLVLEYLILTGLPNETQRTMDQGRKRTSAQQLQLLGYTSAARLAAGVRLSILWERGALWVSGRIRPVVSTAEQEEWLVEHDDLYQLVKSRISQVDSAAHMAWLLKAAEIAPDDALAFHDSLHHLTDLKKGDPILALDHRLRRIAVLRESTQVVNRLGYFVQAWNAWCEGKPLHKVSVPKTGWSVRNWPELRPGRGDYDDSETEEQ